MKIISLALTLASACFATAAFADMGTKEEQAGCRPDVRKLCANLGKASEDQYRSCLQFHFGELSPKCQQVMTVHQTH